MMMLVDYDKRQVTVKWKKTAKETDAATERTERREETGGERLVNS